MTADAVCRVEPVRQLPEAARRHPLVDGFGNAVSPPVGEWIGSRLRAVLHSEAAA